ncbi:hypothetical protein [Heyndrickxia shackletonii]|uniref:hypothetical protein n=1 Tax=Heyndrickxia shackletonii TaxID=157838 RepID=UPI000ABC2728|nr:hypothetical protein [Heyndrickxia shackletonii]
MDKLKIVVDENGRVIVWMNGKRQEGIYGIEFFARAGESTRHKIEYITGFPVKRDEVK